MAIRAAHAASVALFALLSAFLMWFGWVYLTVSEPLWFHAAAVPENARAAVRPLYFALMNLIGGASLALGGLAFIVTLTGVRKREPWAAPALAGAFALVLIVAAVTAEDLARDAGAPTSWRIMGALLALDVLAFGAARAAGRKPGAAAA